MQARHKPQTKEVGRDSTVEQGLWRANVAAWQSRRIYGGGGLGPVVDVAETESEFELLIELPGVEKDGVKLSVELGQDSVTGRPSVGQAMLHGIARQLHVAFQTELFQYARTVRADRIGAHVQLPRDDLEGLPCGQQAQDLKLSV